MPPKAGFDVELHRTIDSFWSLTPNVLENLRKRPLIRNEKSTAHTVKAIYTQST